MVYVRDPGVLGLVLEIFTGGVIKVVWFLDGIKRVEVLEPEEYWMYAEVGNNE